MKKKINLYTIYKDKETKKKSVGSSTLLFSLVLIVALFVAAIGTRLTLDVKQLENENNQLLGAIQTLKKSASVEEINHKQESIKHYQSLNESIVDGFEILEDKRSLNQAFIDKVYSLVPNGLSIETITITFPTVVLEVVYSDQNQAHKFIKNLEALESDNILESTTVTKSDTKYRTTIVLSMGGNY